MVGILRDNLGQLRTGTGIFTRVVSSGPSPDARRSSQSKEFVLVAQNVRGGAAAARVVGFRRWPRRTAGRGLGSLSRFGDGVESVCCGGPQSSVGCGMRGRPSVIASPGSLQRHPARTGMAPEAKLRPGAEPPVHRYVGALPGSEVHGEGRGQPAHVPQLDARARRRHRRDRLGTTSNCTTTGTSITPLSASRRHCDGARWKAVNWITPRLTPGETRVGS